VSDELHIPEGHERGEVMSRPQRMFYAFMRGVVITVAKGVFRASVKGRENLPSTGGYILSPSHRSNLDTPLLAMLTHRRLRYMGKESLWKSKFGGWFLSTLGGFPVSRGVADREAMRAAMVVIERGEPLVMFPEGTRQTGPVIEDENMKDGPAYIACRTGVPIVPMGMAGTEGAMPKGSKRVHPVKIVMVIRPPIYPPARPDGGRVPRRAVHELTKQLQSEIQLAFDEARELAGHPDGY
jgi:1-acyl-sn-glycerol-3-phosphate acyltransferase